ncbi:unnamed protein product [Protopolystoma xenopodis]|uniref:Secreted protein n=1 Tax=Protopolystoma xenopodis TaxID=117903 RepID=A0A3S5A8F2_9PLAT|nr:unnamed protein product [Protopolystoma xenopodis]
MLFHILSLSCLRADVDSGGGVHGPMDHKHSANLSRIHRNGQKLFGRKGRWTQQTESLKHGQRRLSETGMWDSQSE